VADVVDDAEYGGHTGGDLKQFSEAAEQNSRRPPQRLVAAAGFAH
jgi:hypothetical protein